jgi:hypothetical protein
VAVDLELWRIGIAELAKWACGYGKGRGKLDPVYVQWTEGRDRKQDWKFYSSCADLGHGIAERVGVEERWVNREHDDVGGPWEPVKNVGKLGIPSEPVTGSYIAGLGDIWILSNFPWPRGGDHHVCVYLGPNPDVHGEHLTANYGAGGLSKSEFPGAKISSKVLATDGAGLIYGSKRVCRVVTVPNLVARATRKPDFSGPEEWSATWTGEVKDALESAHGTA